MSKETEAFAASENMLDEEQTKDAAEDRIGNKPQTNRAHQTGHVGNEDGDPFIQQQKEAEGRGGYENVPYKKRRLGGAAGAVQED